MWQPLVSNAVQPRACVGCGGMSSWHPRGWFYRVTPIRGNSRNGPKVFWERLCPRCAKTRVQEVRHGV